VLSNTAVEHLDVLALRPGIAAFDQRQVDLVHADGGDLHLLVPLLSFMMRGDPDCRAV
jgi:hypothetical protein